METTTSSGSRPWRSYLRLSLRTLIVLTLVVGGGLGWFVQHARTQRAAVKAVEKAGGVVKYNWEYKDGRSIAGGRPVWPLWLVRRLGVDYFGRVVRVDLSRRSGAKASDDVLAPIAQLDGLEDLDLHGPSITDAGLVHLERLTRLNALTLFTQQVTDAGLAHLKGLTGLERLVLSNTKITDAGLANLEAMSRLQTLQILQTPITDAGLVHLKGLTRLENLSLARDQITDAGLEHLSGLKSLSGAEPQPQPDQRRRAGTPRRG